MSMLDIPKLYMVRLDLNIITFEYPKKIKSSVEKIRTRVLSDLINYSQPYALVFCLYR